MLSRLSMLQQVAASSLLQLESIWGTSKNAKMPPIRAFFSL